MAHNKTIAIIGATGNVGSAIAKCLSVTSNRLLLMANEAEQLAQLISEIKLIFPQQKLKVQPVRRKHHGKRILLLWQRPPKREKKLQSASGRSLLEKS